MSLVSVPPPATSTALHRTAIGGPPDRLSARQPAAPWQQVAFWLVAVAGLAGGLLLPEDGRAVLLSVLSAPFLGLAGLRLVALCLGTSATSGPPLRQCFTAPPPGGWPDYCVLVPLYKERAVLPGLVAALGALDYPEDRLEIALVVEADDAETRDAIGGLRLPHNMTVIEVPPGEPRTKPRALNFALNRTGGEIVTVFDAEDVPEPHQLREAAIALAAGGPRMGCVQARLNVYNRHDSFLTRQFTIEYTAQFDRLLGALRRLGLPMPLGGTSNHFPRRVLEEVGGWDAWNVTEDADLGLRLARLGYQVGVLEATTWEEAPARLSIWKGQRTRWLKGWMQTWIVHMRRPRELLADLGPSGFLAFQLLMGGMVLSALVDPWFYLMLALGDGGGLFAMPGDALSRVLWVVGLLNIALGYAAAIALGMASVVRRGWKALALHALLMPAYWLMVSLAAYRALGQLATRPFYWEKTEHAARPPGAGTAQG